MYLLRQPLDPRRDTFPKRFQSAGYQTGLFGKWHLVSTPTGFDDYRVLPDQGRYQDPLFLAPGAETPVAIPGWSTDVIADLTIDFIRNRDRRQPFLAVCCFKATHDPWDSREPHRSLWTHEDLPEPPNLHDEYEGREAAERATLKLEQLDQRTMPHHRLEDADRDTQRSHVYQQYVKRYLRCGRVLDENVGRLLRFLDEEGLADDTIVVYAADQGHFLGEHGFFSKRFIYDESMRIPLIVRYPARLAAGEVNTDMISNVDIAPTLLELAGLPPSESMQGRSFVENMLGATPDDWPQAVYYRYWQHLLHRRVTAHYGVRTKDAKLIFFYGHALGLTDYPSTEPVWEFFDLRSDPAEMRNRYAAADQQARISQMKRLLDEYRRRVGDTDEDHTQARAARHAAP